MKQLWNYVVDKLLIFNVSSIKQWRVIDESRVSLCISKTLFVNYYKIVIIVYTVQVRHVQTSMDVFYPTHLKFHKNALKNLDSEVRKKISSLGHFI